MDNETPEMIESKQLITKLEELDKKLETSAVERHRVNGIVHSTLNKLALKTEALSNQTDEQNNVLDQIQKSVAASAESVQRIEQCLVGDPKFDRQGLIKDVLEIKAVNIALDTRLRLQEDASKANATELRTLRRIAIILFSVLGGLGAAITWLRQTGFFKFISGS